MIKRMTADEWNDLTWEEKNCITAIVTSTVDGSVLGHELDGQLIDKKAFWVAMLKKCRGTEYEAECLVELLGV